MSDAHTWLDGNFDTILDDLLDFVRIPSVSADSAYARQVRRAAQFLANQLGAAGLPEVEILETAGNPVVFAASVQDRRRPTVLVYGHYDVQPPDPLDRWQTPPFEPAVADGLIRARGVSDDKAPLFIAVKAVEAFLRSGESLPVNVKFMFEGEEEIGSPSLEAFLSQRAELLSADMVLSADGGMWLADYATVVNQARGLVGLELTLRGAAKDLHSGRHGGGLANPLHALATLLHGLHDQDGRIAVEGFYDGVEDIAAGQRAQLAALPFSDTQYLQETGAPATFGEAGYGTLERQWYRPTLEVNGMWGGYLGEGSKTVLPAEAHAKITCRLVPGQEPERIRDLLVAHLRTHLPPGVTLEIAARGAGARAYRVPPDHAGLQVALDVLRDTFRQEPLLVGMGGTLPVCEQFSRLLGVDTIFFSFAVGDENIHAPNEFFRVERLRKGMWAWVEYFRRLPRAWPGGTAGAGGSRQAAPALFAVEDRA